MEAVEITALFNFMNRLIEGTSVNLDYGGETKDHTVAAGGKETLRDSYRLDGDKLKWMVAEKF